MHPNGPESDYFTWRRPESDYFTLLFYSLSEFILNPQFASSSMCVYCVCEIAARAPPAMHGESASMLRSCCPACILRVLRILRVPRSAMHGLAKKEGRSHIIAPKSHHDMNDECKELNQLNQLASVCVFEYVCLLCM